MKQDNKKFLSQSTVLTIHAYMLTKKCKYVGDILWFFSLCLKQKDSLNLV